MVKKTHVSARHGADRSRRSPALRVFEPLPGTPETRGDCRGGERPCRYVHCAWHLWLVEGRDRPGRRFDGKSPPTTLRAAWLEDPMPPSCALDVAESVGERGRLLTVEQIAKAIGLRPSRLRFIMATAVSKLKAARDSNLGEFVDGGETMDER